VASWDVKKTVEWVGSLFPDDERREKYMTLFRTEEIAASDRAVFTEERLARMIPFGPRTTILAAYSQLTGAAFTLPEFIVRVERRNSHSK
jgi:hypothetical protein